MGHTSKPGVAQIRSSAEALEEHKSLSKGPEPDNKGKGEFDFKTMQSLNAAKRSRTKVDFKAFANSSVVVSEAPRSHSNKGNSIPKSTIAFGSRCLERANCDHKKANLSRSRACKGSGKNTQKESDKRGRAENEESSENISDNILDKSSRDLQKQKAEKTCRGKQGFCRLGYTI